MTRVSILHRRLALLCAVLLVGASGDASAGVDSAALGPASSELLDSPAEPRVDSIPEDVVLLHGLGRSGRVMRPLAGELAMMGSARLSCFAPDLTASELLAGVQLSILQIAYRVVDFELAPTMHGPEVGIVLAF